jgi:hypothetical protein
VSWTSGACTLTRCVTRQVQVQTTPIIDDGVMRGLKREAARQRRTISESVEVALRRMLDEKPRRAQLALGDAVAHFRRVSRATLGCSPPRLRRGRRLLQKSRPRANLCASDPPHLRATGLINLAPLSPPRPAQPPSAGAPSPRAYFSSLSSSRSRRRIPSALPPRATLDSSSSRCWSCSNFLRSRCSYASRSTSMSLSNS